MENQPQKSKSRSLRGKERRRERKQQWEGQWSHFEGMTGEKPQHFKAKKTFINPNN